jgi:predicted 3-demethylubiquinone-9 3-methyltransferase (glyoxalase superfamily)
MTITTFLMFEGRASEAIELYVGLFGGAVETMTRMQDGRVQHATFRLRDKIYAAIDSPAKHDFTFTPAISLFVDCADEAEFDTLFAALSSDGKVLMPPDNYGFSRKFAWCNDRFGVSWQINLV